MNDILGHIHDYLSNEYESIANMKKKAKRAHQEAKQGMAEFLTECMVQVTKIDEDNETL